MRISDWSSDVCSSDLPAVRTHPETGRKALYVNLAHTTHFEGMTEEESAPILEFPFRHQVKAEFTCRFRWEKGSVAFWDTRCAQHNPIHASPSFPRLIPRVTRAGSATVGGGHTV